MNCSRHVALVAVAQCNECGRGLCDECSQSYDPPTCFQCVADAAARQKMDAIKLIVITAALFLVGTSLGYSLAHTPGVPPPFPPLITALLFGYMLASVPSGWRTLTNITPRVFLILPLAGWVLYFVFKLSASATIGPFILPFKLSSSIFSVFGVAGSRWKILIPLAGFGVAAAIIVIVLSVYGGVSPAVRQPGTKEAPQSLSNVQNENHVVPIAAPPMSQEDRRVHQLVGQAEQLYSNGKFDEALASLNEALVLNDGDQAAIGLRDRIQKAKAASTPNSQAGSDGGIVGSYKLTPTKPSFGEPDGYNVIVERCYRSGEQIKCEGKAENLTDATTFLELRDSQAVDDEGNSIGIWTSGAQFMFPGANSIYGSRERLIPGVPTKFLITISDPHRNVKTINLDLHTHWEGDRHRYDELVFKGVAVQ